jgi:hypothetical protein
MDGPKGGGRGEPGHRSSAHARRRLASLAAALFACALGSVPALAAPDLTPVTLPPVGQVQEPPPPVPDGSSPTTAPAPPPTTAPAPTTPPQVSPSPTAGPTSTEGERGTGSRRRRGSSGRTRSAPAEQPPTTALVDASHKAEPDGPAFDRLRDASLPAARQFSFPLGLGAAVLVFLAVQGRLDGRDPKLATAPVSVRDDLLPFT